MLSCPKILPGIQLAQIRVDVGGDRKVDGSRHEPHPQAEQQPRQIALAGLQLLKQVFRVHTVAGEIRTFFVHSAQQSFSALIDKSHLIQINNAAFQALGCVLFFPILSKLANPWPNQLTLQNPAALGLRFCDGDL